MVEESGIYGARVSGQFEDVEPGEKDLCVKSSEIFRSGLVEVGLMKQGGRSKEDDDVQF